MGEKDKIMSETSSSATKTHLHYHACVIHHHGKRCLFFIKNCLLPNCVIPQLYDSALKPTPEKAHAVSVNLT